MMGIGELQIDLKNCLKWIPKILFKEQGIHMMLKYTLFFVWRNVK